MENKRLTIVVGTTILLTSIVLGALPAYAQSHYQIGYDDGCAGRVVPGSHTPDYKRGYADGQAACSQNPNNSPNPPSSPSSTQGQDSHYQIGYDDGCAGRVVTGHHTSEYRRGYADGQAACAQNGRPSPEPPANGGNGKTIEDLCNQYHDQLQLSQPCNYYVNGNQLQGPGTFFILCNLVKLGVSTHTLGLLTSIVPCG